MKKLIASENSFEALEKLLSESIDTSLKIKDNKVYIQGKWDKSYKIERFLNRYNCYELNAKQSLEDLHAERNRLLLSKTNPERLAEIQAKIDYVEWGIK